MEEAELSPARPQLRERGPELLNGEHNRENPGCTEQRRRNAEIEMDPPLDPLVKAYGGQQKAYDAVSAQFKKVAGNYTAAELKTDIPVKVGNFTITVRGSIVKGEPRIGTFFVPPE